MKRAYKKKNTITFKLLQMILFLAHKSMQKLAIAMEPPKTVLKIKKTTGRVDLIDVERYLELKDARNSTLKISQNFGNIDLKWRLEKRMKTLFLMERGLNTRFKIMNNNQNFLVMVYFNRFNGRCTVRSVAEEWRKWVDYFPGCSEDQCYRLMAVKGKQVLETLLLINLKPRGKFSWVMYSGRYGKRSGSDKWPDYSWEPGTSRIIDISEYSPDPARRWKILAYLRKKTNKAIRFNFVIIEFVDLKRLMTRPIGVEGDIGGDIDELDCKNFIKEEGQFAKDFFCVAKVVNKRGRARFILLELNRKTEIFRKIGEFNSGKFDHAGIASHEQTGLWEFFYQIDKERNLVKICDFGFHKEDKDSFDPRDAGSYYKKRCFNKIERRLEIKPENWIESVKAYRNLNTKALYLVALDLNIQKVVVIDCLNENLIKPDSSIFKKNRYFRINNMHFFLAKEIDYVLHGYDFMKFSINYDFYERHTDFKIGEENQIEIKVADSDNEVVLRFNFCIVSQFFEFKIENDFSFYKGFYVRRGPVIQKFFSQPSFISGDFINEVRVVGSKHEHLTVNFLPSRQHLLKQQFYQKHKKKKTKAESTSNRLDQGGSIKHENWRGLELMVQKKILQYFKFSLDDGLVVMIDLSYLRLEVFEESIIILRNFAFLQSGTEPNTGYYICFDIDNPSIYQIRKLNNKVMKYFFDNEYTDKVIVDNYESKSIRVALVCKETRKRLIVLEFNPRKFYAFIGNDKELPVESFDLDFDVINFEGESIRDSMKIFADQFSNFFEAKIKNPKNIFTLGHLNISLYDTFKIVGGGIDTDTPVFNPKLKINYTLRPDKCIRGKALDVEGVVYIQTVTHKSNDPSNNIVATSSVDEEGENTITVLSNNSILYKSRIKCEPTSVSVSRDIVIGSCELNDKYPSLGFFWLVYYEESAEERSIVFRTYPDTLGASSPFRSFMKVEYVGIGFEGAEIFVSHHKNNQLFFNAFYRRETPDNFLHQRRMILPDRVMDYDFLTYRNGTDMLVIIFSTDLVEFKITPLNLKNSNFMETELFEIDAKWLERELKELKEVKYIQLELEPVKKVLKIILDADDLKMIEYTTKIELDYENKKVKFVDFGVNNNEIFIKPILFYEYHCEGTKDYLVCAVPEPFNYYNFGNNLRMKTNIFIWKKLDYEDENYGYTYRIEDIGNIDPEGSIAVENYNENRVYVVKEGKGVFLYELIGDVFLVEDTSNVTLASLDFDDYDITIKENNWTSSSFKFKADQFLNYSPEINIPGHHLRLILIGILIPLVLSPFLTCILVCFHRRKSKSDDEYWIEYIEKRNKKLEIEERRKFGSFASTIGLLNQSDLEESFLSNNEIPL